MPVSKVRKNLHGLMAGVSGAADAVGQQRDKIIAKLGVKEPIRTIGIAAAGNGDAAKLPCAGL